MTSPAPPRRIIGLLTRNQGVAADVVAGIRDFAQSHPDWQVIAATYEPAAEQLVGEWSLDGVIFDGDRPWLGYVQPLRVPRVNMNYNPTATGSPSVIIDDDHVSQLALDHFLERQIKRFAFVGYSDSPFSLRRERFFRERVEAVGGRLRVFRRSYHRLANWQGPALGRWLGQLRPPVGLFMCHDALGFRVIEGCRQAGRVIPRDVAVLGVDNLTVDCELVRPTLSSVLYPGRQIGWECAAALDRLIRGDPPPSRALRVKSPGIMTRTSTDVFHFGDPVVAQALQFMRDHADVPMSVEAVLDAVPVSRSVLERRFREVLGATPLQEIQRVHVNRAKELLLRSAAPLAVVARHSGFRHASHLSQVFKKVAGLSPSAFRASRGEAASGEANP